MEEQEESFRITPPHYIKDFFVGVTKWGPAWMLVFILSWFLWSGKSHEATRAEDRENALIKALQDLSQPILSMQGALNDHMGTSQKTQLFISVMCANNANTSQQRRACFDEYYAQEMKDRATNR